MGKQTAIIQNPIREITPEKVSDLEPLFDVLFATDVFDLWDILKTLNRITYLVQTNLEYDIGEDPVHLLGFLHEGFLKIAKKRCEEEFELNQ